MSSTTVQLAHSGNMGLYEPPQQFSMWKDVFKDSNASAIVAAGADPTNMSSLMKVDSSLHRENEYASDQPMGHSDNDDDSNRHAEKLKRRLSQNREAARKSRLRKKAYVQQLESSRLKLAQVEQELERAKHQNFYVGSALNGSFRHLANINTGIVGFEMEYSHWIEEQYRRTLELRVALQANVSDVELKILVDGLLDHYYGLFRMKANAAKADVFYLISGTWRTPVERFFLWIGGFRPSEILSVVRPHLEPLTEDQQADIKKLQHSSQQAEFALTQGLDRLHQSFGQIMLPAVLSETLISSAIEKLRAIEGFVNQADYVREQALLLMARILTTHQAARGLLALGDYFHRLSALSSIWTACPQESA